MLRRIRKSLQKRWSNQSLLGKGLVVIAIPVAPLLLLSLLYFPAERHARALDAELRYGLELEQRSRALIIAIQDARTSLSGYVLTGEPARRAKHDEAMARIPGAMDRLEEDLRERPGGEERAREVRRLADRKVEALRETLGEWEARPAGERSPTPEAGLLVEEGDAIMDSLRTVLAPLRTRADSLLAAGGGPGRTQAPLPSAVVAAVALLGILGGVGGGVLFARSIAGRIRLLEWNARKLGRPDADLASVPPSTDEVGRLARSLEKADRILRDRQGALRESEERFSLAVRGSRDGLWDWDLERDQVYFSPRWKELLGYGEGEIDDDFAEFEARVHPEDLPRVKRHLSDYLEGRADHYQVEFRMRHRDGSWRWILARGLSVRDEDGRPVRLTGFHSDVTERRTREEELREARRQAETATRAKSAFLAAMSHELRTPLNAVIGFGELLEEEGAGELNPGQARYVENILSSGRHLLELINDILDLSKVEAGRVQLDLRELEPGTVLRGSLDIVRGIADRKRIRLETDLPDGLPALVADEGRLKQILYNLLSNAVKFTEEGGRVTLGARAEEDRLRIWVRDTGVGIAEADQERIFGEFEQADSSLAREHEGTGLGLTLVRRLSELHGGEVSLESRPGEGSTFTVLLPLRGPPEVREEGRITSDDSDAPADARTGEDIEGDGATVLIVEDDAWARQLLTEYLHEAGYRTVLARDGEDALDVARRVRPAAITLDILLPGRNGWEVLAALKDDPATRDIPVFIVTVTEDEERGFNLGAAAYFQKPVDRQGLVSGIRRLVPGSGGGGARILVVDDEPKAVELVREVLREEGHEVLAAHGGREGIGLARRERPDLVILDLLMPEVTGFEVAAALREDPETRGIPILVWTAKDLTDEDRERLNRHVQAVCVKNGLEEFLEDLRRVLREGAPEEAG